MPKTEYELTTPMAVGKQDMLDLLQDPKRFLISGGSTEESSIRYDEATDKWHGTCELATTKRNLRKTTDEGAALFSLPAGTSTTGIPILSKPKFQGTFKKTDNGSQWYLEATAGVVTTHEWSVEEVSEEECKVTEKATFEGPPWVFYPAQWQLKSLQQKTHKNIQEYMT